MVLKVLLNRRMQQLQESIKTEIESGRLDAESECSRVEQIQADVRCRGSETLQDHLREERE